MMRANSKLMADTPNKPPIPKAVALHYNATSDQPPRITASGRGHIAEQILTLAFASGVRVREDADLVDVLEKLDVDSPIPIEAFAAVAEILHYVYQLNATYGDPRTTPCTTS